MDLAAVFLLSLLGGYYFAYFWKRTAYTTLRLEGHHLYFRAAFFGVVLFAIAIGVRQALLALGPGYKVFDDGLVQYIKPALKEEGGLGAAELRSRAEWVVTAVYSLAIGPVAAWVLNLFTPRWWALERSLSGLDRLLLQAQLADMPVCLTLTTGKVYIGPVVSITDPNGMAMVTLLPVFSGYRDAEGRMTLTTDYDRVYADLERGGAAQLDLPTDWQSRFQLAIQAETIVTAALFSPSVYAKFTPDWREQMARTHRKSTPRSLSQTST